MNKRRVNSITYGALLSALLGVFLLFNRQTGGLFDAYMLWIIPLPVIVYCLKFDIKQGMIMGVAMALLSFIVATPMTAFYVASSIVAGLIYADGLKKEKSSMQLILSVILVSMFITVVTMIIFAKFFGYSLTADIDYTRDSVKMMIEAMAKVLGPEVLENPLLKLMLSRNFLLYIIVLSSLLTSILEGILVHLLAILILRRLKMPGPKVRPLSEIKAPWYIKVFVVITYVLMILNGFNIPFINQYSEIIMGLMPVAYIFCGFFAYLLALTWINLRIPGRNSRILLVFIFMFLLMFAPPVIMVAGLLDMFTDTRDRILKGIRYEQNR